MIDFIKKYLIIVLCSLLTGGLIGYFAHKPQVEIKEKIVTVEKQVEVEKIVKNNKLDSTKAVVKHVVITKIVNKDGSSTTTKTEDVGINTIVHDIETKFVDRVVDHVVYQDREIIKTTKEANWLIGGLVGINLYNINLNNGLNIGALDFGVSVSRRIIGPIYVGIYGYKSGNLGLSISMAF